VEAAAAAAAAQAEAEAEAALRIQNIARGKQATQEADALRKVYVSLWWSWECSSSFTSFLSFWALYAHFTTGPLSGTYSGVGRICCRTKWTACAPTQTISQNQRRRVGRRLLRHYVGWESRFHGSIVHFVENTTVGIYTAVKFKGGFQEFISIICTTEVVKH
jgi:hypothetical protein